MKIYLYNRDVKSRLNILVLFLLATELNAVTDSFIIPGPEPFSLDAESAVYCIDLLKSAMFIEVRNENKKTDIVRVQTVWSWFLSYNEGYPPGHRRRYDIIVNNEAVDWDNSFIEYGGEMKNLRMLFLYRNQYPPQGLQYR